MFAAGLLGFDPDSVTHFFSNCLMVVGGFVVGFVVTGLTALGFDQWVSHRKSAPALHKVARYLGGLVGAILVALYVFGDGRGGGGKGGSGDPSATQGTGNAVSAATTPTPPTTKPAPPTLTTEPIRVTILGGYHEDGKYYLLDDEDNKAVDLDAAKAYLRTRKAHAATSPSVQIRLHPVNRTTLDNKQVVKPLIDFVEQERLTPTFPGDGR